MQADSLPAEPPGTSVSLHKNPDFWLPLNHGKLSFSLMLGAPGTVGGAALQGFTLTAWRPLDPSWLEAQGPGGESWEGNPSGGGPGGESQEGRPSGDPGGGAQRLEWRLLFLTPSPWESLLPHTEHRARGAQESSSSFPSTCPRGARCWGKPTSKLTGPLSPGVCPALQRPLP